jgi:hypothetical protein
MCGCGKKRKENVRVVNEKDQAKYTTNRSRYILINPRRSGKVKTKE